MHKLQSDWLSQLSAVTKQNKNEIHDKFCPACICDIELVSEFAQSGNICCMAKS